MKKLHRLFKMNFMKRIPDSCSLCSFCWLTSVLNIIKWYLNFKWKYSLFHLNLGYCRFDVVYGIVNGSFDVNFGFGITPLKTTIRISMSLYP